MCESMTGWGNWNPVKIDITTVRLSVLQCVTHTDWQFLLLWIQIESQRVLRTACAYLLNKDSLAVWLAGKERVMAPAARGRFRVQDQGGTQGGHRPGCSETAPHPTHCTSGHWWWAKSRDRVHQHRRPQWRTGQGWGRTMMATCASVSTLLFAASIAVVTAQSKFAVLQCQQ